MPVDVGTLLSKGRPIARALRAVSMRTRKPFTMQTKSGRFLIQKTVYLLKVLGYEPARKYEYNIYLNGPYSPDLATIYYALEDSGLRDATSATDIPPRALDAVADALAESPDFLEGLTTVVDGCITQGGPTRALGWAKSIKPHLSDTVWQEVRAFLRRHPELIRHT